MDGHADARVGAATTEIALHDAVDGDVDVCVHRIRSTRQQRGRAHQLAGLTVSALRHVEVDPGLLQCMQLVVVGRALDADHLALTHIADPQHAGSWATRSICTVQAPHWVMLQPNFVATRCVRLRSSQTKGMSGATSWTSCCWPLTCMCNGFACFLRRDL